MIDATFDLFVELGASDEQCDFPVVYASGVNGVAGSSPQELAADLQPLFESIVREIEPPMVAPLPSPLCIVQICCPGVNVALGHHQTSVTPPYLLSRPVLLPDHFPA